MNDKLRKAGLALGLAALIAAATAAVNSAESDGSTAPVITTLVDAQPDPATAPAGQATPLWQLLRDPASGVVPATQGRPGGYRAGDFAAELHLSGDGAGQTVAVTVAFDVQAGLTAALEEYNKYLDLPPACSESMNSGCFPLTVTAPDGTSTPASPFTFAQWAVESELDVEAIHAIAPRASILVVEAKDNQEASLMSAIDYAVSQHTAVISNSWGSPESADESSLDVHCQADGAVCVFGSGDTGNPGMYPAASPDVLAVGGTTLTLGPTGTPVSETAWQGSGGGISAYEKRPAYQSTADPYTAGRGIPDVSFDADPNSGLAALLKLILPSPWQTETSALWAELGGTSFSAPAWAAILAVADQQRAGTGKPPLTIGQIHSALYQPDAAGLLDITIGANGICAGACVAHPGYDLVTGMGSPRPGIDTYLAAR